LAESPTSRFPPLTATLAGGFLVAFGVWAMFAPVSFFDQVATFEPYNRHLIQDIGAFQIGLGAVLLLAVALADSMATALIGVGIGSLSHLGSHLLGLDLGGRPEVDLPAFGGLGLLLLLAGWVRLRSQRAT
jgi:hypothetical protein